MLIAAYCILARRRQELLLDYFRQDAAIYPVSGALAIDGMAQNANTMAYQAPGAWCLVPGTGRASAWPLARNSSSLAAPRSTVIVSCCGNLVSSRKERLAQAAKNWEQWRYGSVQGETEWIPLPWPRP